MTKNNFEIAKAILERIEEIEDFKRVILSDPRIVAKGNDYVYLSRIDNEDEDLKETVIKWCQNEIKRLEKEFEKL